MEVLALAHGSPPPNADHVRRAYPIWAASSNRAVREGDTVERGLAPERFNAEVRRFLQAVNS